VILEGAQALLVTIYECKDARRIYEQCKDVHDSAVDKVQSSGNKAPDKQQQAQEELRQAQQKFDAAKAHFKLKCQEVEQKKRTFLKNNLTQYIQHIETGVPVGTVDPSGADHLHVGDSPRSSSNSNNTAPPPFGVVSNPAPAKSARPSDSSALSAMARRGSDSGANGNGRGAGSPDQNPFGTTAGGGKRGSIGDDFSVGPVIDPNEIAAAAQKAPSQVKALYDYAAQTDGELSFSAGDVIRVRGTTPDGWWTGEVNGKVGQFPITYVDLNS